MTRRLCFRGQDPFFLVVGFYEDGRVGELSFYGRKQDPLLNHIFIAASLGLQTGTPLEHYTSRWRGTKFEPAGLTEDEQFPLVSSVLDYVARYLESRFVASN